MPTYGRVPVRSTFKVNNERKVCLKFFFPVFTRILGLLRYSETFLASGYFTTGVRFVQDNAAVAVVATLTIKKAAGYL